MSNTIRIKRRANGGGSGAPASLANAELAYNEQTDILYYGKGTGGEGGTATAAEAISGKGAFVDLASTQDVTGAKTFTGAINVPTPTADAHAANKGYVDAVARGLDWKPSVRVATGSNITLSGVQTIDGVSVVAGDRVLVRAQSTASGNGIYTVVSGAAWTRADDFSATGGPGGTPSATAGATVFVSEGTTYGNTSWTCTTDDPITLGTTALTFSQIAGSGSETTAANVGASGTGVFFGTQGNELQFRKLAAGTGLSLAASSPDNGTLTYSVASNVGLRDGLNNWTDRNFFTALVQITAPENAGTDSLGGLLVNNGIQVGWNDQTVGKKVTFRTASNATSGGAIVFGSDGTGSAQAGVLGEIKNLKTPVVDHDAANKAYVDTQVGGKQNADADLTAIAALTGTSGILRKTAADTWSLDTAAYLTSVGTSNIANSAVTYTKIQNVSATDKLLGRSTAGAGVVEEITCTAAGRALIDDADAAAQRTTLGLGTAATQASTAFAAATHDHAIANVTGLQTALDGKQAGDATLTALAGVTTAANKLIYATGADAFATTDLTTFGRSLIDDADAATARTTLGLGTAATQASTAFQSADATLTALAGVTTAANKLIYATGADAFATTDLTAFARGFLDDADAAAGRTTLGLGTMATQSASSVAITGGTIAGVTIDGGTF